MKPFPLWPCTDLAEKIKREVAVFLDSPTHFGLLITSYDCNVTQILTWQVAIATKHCGITSCGARK